MEATIGTTVDGSHPLLSQDARAMNRERFEIELEFVQSLANPYYLHSLAQQNILDQPAFINFLDYLQYWREKDYARFIQYEILWTVAVRLMPIIAILTLYIISNSFNSPVLDQKSRRMNGESISTRDNLTIGVHGISFITGVFSESHLFISGEIIPLHRTRSNWKSTSLSIT